MQYPQHLKPFDRFLRVLYLGNLSMAEPIEEFATWCITGVAAIVALMLANLEAISKIVGDSSLRWGIVLLTTSILFGVVAKQLGIGIRKGIGLLESLYAELSTPEGQAAIAESDVKPEDVPAKIAEPYLWPLKRVMLSSAKKGSSDAIAGEKRFVRLLCVQMYASFLQGLCGISGILTLALGIK